MFKYKLNVLLGILELAAQTKMEIQLSSLETKYVRMYRRLEAVEKCEKCQQQIGYIKQIMTCLEGNRQIYMLREIQDHFPKIF